MTMPATWGPEHPAGQQFATATWSQVSSLGMPRAVRHQDRAQQDGMLTAQSS
eukprot:CAMPEP_0115120066 /NCGR_PEP_ID=MMETSP0227-20121206/45463_1 /TAXON_ID=89957 /ORGANISM="Polarella glacialis, Strain CCMP 1383" /LENGTH=51 /DNA_ID=CAMNT_0002521651 /DNA_START=18 /DNA_END=169 /DNA_ORIENTATION=-